MKSKMWLMFRRAHGDQRGQALPWVAFGMVGFLGMAGMTIDVGRAYVAYNHLQATTNAAALAAAQATTNTSNITVSSEASAFGSGTGGKNIIAGLQNVQVTPSTLCLNILMPKGSTCSAGSVPNAVKVVQTAQVNTYFLKVLGIRSIALKTTAQAAMQGLAQPWNVAIILDATGSMGNLDSDCGGVTEFQCATSGIKSLLSVVNPCASGYTNCATSNANLRVALFSFPGVSTSTVSYDSNCGGTPDYMQYTLPLPTATSYTPLTYTKSTTSYGHTTTSSWTATYQIVDFSSDYYANGALNTNSALVKAVTGCMSPIVRASSATGGLNGASSGGITYYVGAIYAAQAALLNQQALHPGTKNAIILLSDGQANLYQSTSDFPGDNGYSLAAGQSGYASAGVNGTNKYPDIHDECQQGIVAAQSAQAAGTTVYSVAYGSEQSGCGISSSAGYTDKGTVVATGTNAPFGSVSALSPCVTMENMASSLGTFYSDFNQSGSGSTCQDSSHSVSSLQDIFLSIAGTLTNPQLLPRNAK